MKEYYYTDGKDKFGPYSLDDLKTKGLQTSTLVWHQGLKDWMPAGELDELKNLFEATGMQGGDSEPSTPPLPPAKDQRLSGSPPKSWLVESILVTIFCCLPFGIVGIINAARVESRFGSGDYEGALKASREAGTWTKLSFWIGLGLIIIYSIMVFAGLITGIDV